MKVLIIEDNVRLAERVRKTLATQYIVDVAHQGERGLEKIQKITYGVIVLDLGLPDMTGLEVCIAIRKAGVFTPILILTGSDEVELRVKLLNNGADDYLAKPFHKEELLARVTALSRRQAYEYKSNTITVHDLEIDVYKRQVRRSGVLIDLRRKEFDILQYLVSNCGRTVTREMILDHAWSTDKESWHNTVDVHIKHLRDKVDRPFAKSLIKTAHGIGYMVDDIESK